MTADHLAEACARRRAATAGEKTDTTPAPGAGEWRRAGVAIVAAVVVAGVVSLAIQWVVGRMRAPWPSSVRNDLVALSMAVVLAAAVLLVGWGRWPRWALPASWVLTSASVTLPLSFALLGTRYYLGGIGVDQSFRTEYLTRMTASPAFADFAYQGVAPYYPLTWFWLGGRFANLAHLPGWAAYKPWAILTLAIVAVTATELWALLTSRRVAFLLGLVTLTLGLLVGAEEPYSWLITATLPPLAVLAWRWVGTLTGAERTSGTKSTAVALGIAVGVYGDLYTLYMAFFALLLVVMGVLALVLTRRGYLRVGGNYLIVAGVAAVILLPVWAAYLLALLSGRSGTNIAAHYLPASGATFPLPMLDVSVLGGLCLIGTGWLAWKFRGDQFASGLGVTAAVCYLWYLLSFAVILLPTTLLAFRIYNILLVVLVCAAVFALLTLLSRATEWFTAHGARLRTLAGMLVFAFLIGTVQATPGIANPEKTTFGDYYPTGTTPVGRSDPSDGDYWVPRLNATIQQMSGRRPQDTVVLSNQLLLMITTPYWSFQAASPQYANPLGEFADRNALINSWAGAHDPHQLITELDRSPYRAPTVFVFNRSARGLTLKTTRDLFPAQPNVGTTTLTFSPELFRDPQFSRRDVGPYTVITRARDAAAG